MHFYGRYSELTFDIGFAIAAVFIFFSQTQLSFFLILNTYELLPNANIIIFVNVEHLFKEIWIFATK